MYSTYSPPVTPLLSLVLLNSSVVVWPAMVVDLLLAMGVAVLLGVGVAVLLGVGVAMLLSVVVAVLLAGVWQCCCLGVWQCCWAGGILHAYPAPSTATTLMV